MKYKNLTVDDKKNIIEIWYNDTLTKAEKVTKIAKVYNLGERTVYSWVKNIQNNDKDFISTSKITIISDDAKKIHKLEEENKQLKNALNEAKNHVIDSDEIKRFIYELNDVELKAYDNIPNWMNKKTKNEIIPVFCLSDTHIGSVIDPADVNYVNEYNVEIAKKRIFGLTKDFISMYKDKLANYSYPGVIVNFGGDMIENAMHGTEETNELTVVDQTIEATNILITVIKMLNEAFGNVTIFAVSGNHGRLIADKYTKNTNRLGNSLEKIVYHFIGVHFKDKPEVSIITRQSDIIHYEVNGKTFRLEHGDSIPFTGQAISGPLNSFERARLKRNGMDSAVGRRFDYLIFGHFHQHLISNTGIIVMDSTKGYDSYVMRMSLPFNLPGATTFSINNRGEIIFATNLKCRDEQQPADTKSEYIKIYQ